MTMTATKSRSMLVPTITSAFRRVWALRWSPIVLGVFACLCTARAWILYDRRVTHMIPVQRAADLAVDHPFKYTAEASQVATEAFRDGVHTVLWIMAALILLCLTVAASKDRSHP